MALAVNGSGTVFKKCDKSNHRPDSNKGLRVFHLPAHVRTTRERCQHAWTLRYWVNGKQIEKSFKDKQHPSTGRVDYGSGPQARARLAAQAHRGQALPVDVVLHGPQARAGKAELGEACRGCSSPRLPVSDASKGKLV